MGIQQNQPETHMKQLPFKAMHKYCVLIQLKDASKITINKHGLTIATKSPFCCLLWCISGPHHHQKCPVTPVLIVYMCVLVCMLVAL